MKDLSLTESDVEILDAARAYELLRQQALSKGKQIEPWDALDASEQASFVRVCVRIKSHVPDAVSARVEALS